MLWLELVLLGLTAAGWLAGIWSIYWVRGSQDRLKILLGKCLFIANLLLLGGSILWAALYRAYGLSPLGLTAGWLVVAMLWETPARSSAPDSSGDLLP